MRTGSVFYVLVDNDNHILLSNYATYIDAFKAACGLQTVGTWFPTEVRLTKIPKHDELFAECLEIYLKGGWQPLYPRSVES